MTFDKNIIEAKLALELIASPDMPRIAWDALEVGLDGPAIRRLAALEHPTYFEVAEVLPRFMTELGLTKVTPADAAMRVAKQIAEDILCSGENPLKHVRDFEGLWIRAGYPCDLDTLGNLDDEVWVAKSMGQSESEIREWVAARLAEFVGTSRSR